MLATRATHCELLAWDTEFWGFPIARVLGNVLDQERAEHIDAWCRRRCVRCLYLLAAPDDAETLAIAEAKRFKAVDLRVTFGRATLPITAVESGQSERPVVRLVRPDDVPTLERIAQGSYHDTRFYQDGSFPKDRCDDLYATWIRRSCDGYADAVLVAEGDGHPVGYVTCHIDQALAAGRIGLVGTNQRERGRGVGSALVDSALEWFSGHGMRRVTVITQARNEPAQRLYRRHGFVHEAAQVWFHKWYGRPIRE